jgi:hypothetical protein
MNRAIIVAGVVIALAVILILETTLNGNLTFAQLLALAEGAGFQGNDVQTAAAVALAESGGNPMAYNPEVAALAPPQKGSYGLWQIYLNVHPEFAGQNLFDPATNAAAAFSVYSAAGNSFSPWSTYGSGAFTKYLPSAS